MMAGLEDVALHYREMAWNPAICAQKPNTAKKSAISVPRDRLEWRRAWAQWSPTSLGGGAKPCRNFAMTRPRRSLARALTFASNQNASSCD
jgi:hypothetical protein